jgi:uncharacterized membrane protein (UPF0127 family)
VIAFALAVLALTFPTGHAVLRTPSKTVTVKVEIARTPQQLVRGLSGRRSLPRNSGMAFVFKQPIQGRFWMKGMQFPLSIAFWGRDGRIIKIDDMAVCRSTECPRFGPRAPFVGALEVNRGALRRWGVHTGDFVKIRG